MIPTISKKLSLFKRRPSPVREIMSFANPATFKKYGWEPKDIISFAGGWVNHKAPKELQDSYIEIAKNNDLFHKSGAYPPTIGTTECRHALANFEKNLYNIPHLTSENIAIGLNSTQLTFILMTVLLDPGDKILLLDPSYCNIPAQITTAIDVDIIRFPVLNKDTWQYTGHNNCEKFRDFILKNKPKVILLISPDNPTSQVLTDDFVSKALSAAKEIGAFLVIDFAYKEIVFNNKYPKYFSWPPNDNFIALHSNSKWCRGLGRRLGWLQATTFVIEAVEAMQGSSILCPDMLHEMALVRYLEKITNTDSIQKYIQNFINKYAKASEVTVNAIKKYLKLPVLTPQGGLYTVVKVNLNGAEFVEKALREQGVLLVPGWGFGRSLLEGIRICYGTLVDNLDLIEKGIQKLKKVLK